MHNKGERKKNREKFFNEFLLSFSKNHAPGLLTDLAKEENLSDLSLGLTDDSSSAINWAYWDLIDNHVRPVILDSNSNNETAEDRIDIYKILSCIEFAILKIKPFYVLHNSNQIHYLSEDYEQHSHIEDVINGFLAFYGAFEFLRDWKGKYSEVFITDHILQVLNEVEDVEHRLNAMTRINEHVYVTTYSSKLPTIPLITNACWWRLLCAFGVENTK